MDPALWEQLQAEAADKDRVLEAIIRMASPEVELPDVQLVARFGSVSTCRIRAADVVGVRGLPGVLSLKAARRLGPALDQEWTPQAPRQSSARLRETDVRRDPTLGVDGSGVLLAAVDWGVDVTSPALQHPPSRTAGGRLLPGGTRLMALWDQRDIALGPRAEPYGYGAVHDREEIDRALLDPRPHERLGYHPAIADRGGGSHGMHVLDIAAGNGRGRGPMGIAPAADLAFVHLADRDTGGLATMGDSVRLLEAVDFISRTAGAKPWVINLSMGRHGGPHNGSTLVEIAFDELLSAAPGRFMCMSAGNYYRARCHASGRLDAGEAQSFTFVVDPADATPNELEVWYDGRDELAVRIDAPGSSAGPWVRLGDRSDLLVDGNRVGRIYHRAHDPNGDNHIDAFLDAPGCAGTWTVTLEAVKVVNGRFDAWLERDDVCRGCQPRFTPEFSTRTTTTGTIANGHVPLVVGAYNGHDARRPPARFSSAGPTRDDRRKPDLAAPGVAVLAARSTPLGTSRSTCQVVRKSGTSMATPQVTGAVALCLSLGGRRLSAKDLRAAVLASCDPLREADPEHRLGRGYLNITRLVAEVGQALAAKTTMRRTEELTMDTEENVQFLAMAPAKAYRECLYRPQGQLARWMLDRFDVVARPGQRFDRPPEVGDLLLEITLGRQDGGRCVALSGAQLDAVTARAALPQGQILLRPMHRLETVDGPMTLAASDAMDAGTDRLGDADLAGNLAEDLDAEQAAFREVVLVAHLERSRRRRGAPSPDLSDAELSRVEGTDIRMASVAASHASQLLRAANRALEDARARGDQSVATTQRISAASGYRASAHQARLWRRYFEDYYQQTREARSQLPGGPHSEAAVAYMLDTFRIPDKIAAPGYSNHQQGIAIDFQQVMDAGHQIRNSTSREAVARWRSTWFYHWLEQNAPGFGFVPYTKEPWHWTYRPQASGGARDVALGEGEAQEHEAEWTPLDEREADVAGESPDRDSESADLLGELYALGYADSPDDIEERGLESAEFSGPEHKSIGDAGSGKESSSISFGSPPQPLSFGDVVSMAGDYFESYEEMRDLGETEAGRIELGWARWHCLGLGKQGIPEPRAPEETKKRVVDRYLALAGRNLSHFSAGGVAWQAYTLWHGKAIADALEAGQTSSDSIWRRALTKEAFGDHFLTDMFSAGHVRTPRAEIRDWYNQRYPGSDKFIEYMARFMFDQLSERQQLPPLLWWVGWVTRRVMADRIRALGGEAVKSFSLGDIVALALHDNDNKGLVVVSDVDPDGHLVPGGYTWTAVGDGHLGRSKFGADTRRMATAAVIGSLRDLERVRGVGVKLGPAQVSLSTKTAEIREALGASGFTARGFAPRESKAPNANVPLVSRDGQRAPLEWRWGQLGNAAYSAVDESVKGAIAGELHDMAGSIADPIEAPLGQRVYGIRNAFLAFVRHLRSDGIKAIEKAVGTPAR
jgi:subtilisin family serine protease/LAS superfamily LD-carboxypeptidase LdcB